MFFQDRQHQSVILAQTRVNNGLSVARRARDCGVSSRQYRRYERGETLMRQPACESLYGAMESHLVVRQPANRGGRDFVVGDLHGHGAILQAMMTQIAFDVRQDRLFSVGDLIDRGPESLSTLRLLREPWFYAVRGNHEDMALDYAGRTGRYGLADRDHPFLANGGSWIRTFSPAEREEFLFDLAPRMALLPHIRIVGKGSDRFHIVHAELDALRARVTDRLLDALVRGSAQESETPPYECIEGFDMAGPWRMRLLWGRSLMESKKLSLPETPELSPTFCGHTVVPTVRARACHVNLDTGAARLGGESMTARLSLGLVVRGAQPSLRIVAEGRSPDCVILVGREGGGS